MNNNSPDFTENTKKILAKMASERCCLCEEITSMPNSSHSGYVRIGEAAHISGARKSSDVRFNENLNNEDRKNLSNGIWLCSNCHTNIDQDEKFYTVAELEKIRANHYMRIRNGSYSTSAFARIDELNAEIIILNERITDKEKLLSQNSRLYESEITGLQIEIQQINTQKEKLWEDYNSILQNLDQAENFEEIYKLVFEENNLERALEYLSDQKLEKDAINLAQKYLLKADIFKLQHKNEASQYYKKAYAVHPTVRIAGFFIRYLRDTNNFNSLIAFILEVLEAPIKIEDRIALNGQLGTIYSKIDPDEGVKYYKTALLLIDKKIDYDPFYYTLKAGFLNYLAACYKNGNNLPEAIKTCEESLSIFLSGKIPEGDKNFYYELASLYNTIARICIINQNYQEAEKYLDSAVKIASEKINDDDGELLATIYINYCNLFETVSKADWLKYKKMIDQTISVFTILFKKNPLQFVEKLAASHCRKADFFFTLKKYDDFHFQLNKAENISHQIVKSNQSGFEFLLADVHLRRACFFIFRENLPMASEEADKALSYFEKSEFNDADTILKYASLALLKCRLNENQHQKKELLLKINMKILPFISNNPPALLIYNEVKEELKKM